MTDFCLFITKRAAGEDRPRAAKISASDQRTVGGGVEPERSETRQWLGCRETHGGLHFVQPTLRFFKHFIAQNKIAASAQRTVGWVEQSETHHARNRSQNAGELRFAQARRPHTTQRCLIACLAAIAFAQPFAYAQQAAAPAPTPTSTSVSGITATDLNLYPEVRTYIDQGQLAAALKVLQTKESQHGDDPTYYNLVGILALKLAAYHDAVSAFERVVLMQPDNAGAWLDLAIASAESGNVSGATAYFDYVEEHFNPPPSVRAVISRYRARLAARSDFSPLQLQLDVMFGVDTNANSGLQNSAIPLTFGAQRIELLLDPSLHARTDQFFQTGVAARYRERLGDSIGELVLGARSRNYLEEKDFSTLSANISGGLHRATAYGDASAWLHLENLWLGGSPLLRNARLVAQLERPYNACRLGISGEAEWRRYASFSTLDANLLWGQAGIACDWKVADLPVQTILIGRSGFDNPTGNRAGGETRHNELIAQVGMPVAWGAQADLSMTWANARDKEGYSPLLEQNAARHLDRQTLRLLVTVPMTRAADLQVIAEDNRFRSNLALFRQNGQTLSAGFRYRF